MADRITRRTFHAAAGGLLLTGTKGLAMTADDQPKPDPKPTEAAFERDYPAPQFKPSFKKPQLNRVLVQDFVIFAHYDLEMVKKLLDREPALVNATMDWGGGDWESGLGGASHTGQRAIAEHLLSKGARVDVFCAAMLGLLDVVKGLLAAYPALIDAKGPHGIPLVTHAKMGGKPAEPVLEFLQSLKPAAPAQKP